MNADDLPRSIDEINRAEALRKRNARQGIVQRVIETVSKVVVWMLRPIGARM
jgi:hypothetical protein